MILVVTTRYEHHLALIATKDLRVVWSGIVGISL